MTSRGTRASSRIRGVSSNNETVGRASVRGAGAGASGASSSVKGKAVASDGKTAGSTNASASGMLGGKSIAYASGSGTGSMPGPSSKPGLTVKHVNQGAGTSAHASRSGFHAIGNTAPEDLRPPTKGGAAADQDTKELKGKGVPGASNATAASRRVPLASGSRSGIPTSSRTASAAPSAAVASRVSVAARPSEAPGASSRPTTSAGVPARSSTAASGSVAVAARVKKTMVKAADARVTVRTEATEVEVTAPAAAASASAAGAPKRAVKRVASFTEPAQAKRSRVSDADEDASASAEATTAVATRTPPPAKDAGWNDLDKDDMEDPLMVSEYVNEIFNYMKTLEVKSMPDSNWVDVQDEITWLHRSTLVDWIIDVHSKFRLVPETLFLAINIIDRMLSLRHVGLGKLQLVGCTAIFVAAKYEEVLCPSVQNFLYLADSSYTEAEILGAERYVLRTLNFDLSYANPMNFLRRISKADDYDIQTRTVAKFFMEISVVDHRLLSHTPSVIAAAAVWLAREVLERGEWDATLVHYSTFSERELLTTAELMLDYCLRPTSRHPNLTRKYAGKKFMRACPYVINWAQTRWADRVVHSTAEPRADKPPLVDLFKAFRYARPSARELQKILGLGREQDLDSSSPRASQADAEALREELVEIGEEVQQSMLLGVHSKAGGSSRRESSAATTVTAPSASGSGSSGSRRSALAELDVNGQQLQQRGAEDADADADVDMDPARRLQRDDPSGDAKWVS